MERITNKWNDKIRNKAISIIRNLSTENSLSFEEKGVLSSFLVIERTENSKLAHYEDMEEQGLLTVIDNETFQRDNLDRCTHRHCNKCDKYRRELQRYKDMENEGWLIELPCAVGDTVWELCKCVDGMYRVYPGTVKVLVPQGSIRRIKNESPSIWNLYATSEYTYMYKSFSDFGKTVFTTKEAAEAKLKEMEGVNE